MYTGGNNLDDDPFVAPLRAKSLAGLPPAIVVLGGCDPLRDEGRLYARRLHDERVEVEEICFARQPHGFVNLEFPAAAIAIERIGAFLRSVFAAKASSFTTTQVDQTSHEVERARRLNAEATRGSVSCAVSQVLSVARTRNAPLYLGGRHHVGGQGLSKRAGDHVLGRAT